MTSSVVAAKAHVEGTHRTVEPKVTLERLQPVVPAIGVTRVGVITGLDLIGIPVVMVVPSEQPLVLGVAGQGRRPPLGPGVGPHGDRRAWHAEHVLLAARLATYRELRTVARVVDVEQLPAAAAVPVSPPISRLLWIEGTDVSHRPSVSGCPMSVCTSTSALPGPQGSGCFLASGTGLAAGNHQLEAVSRAGALREVVERDAFAIWDEREVWPIGRPRRLDLDTVDDPGCRRLLATFERGRGVGVAVLGSPRPTSGSPCSRRLIVDHNPSLMRQLPAALGGGCHPSRAVALSARSPRPRRAD